MNRFRVQVPLKLVKYRTLGLLCCLVVVVKLLVTGTGWPHVGDARGVGGLLSSGGGRGGDIPCPCAREKGGVSLDRTQYLKRGGKTSDTAAAHNGSASADHFQLQLVSEDPLTRHTWPWGGQDLVKSCQMKNWQAKGQLPKVSVVVTFIDKENVATLIRTVHSIVQRTPPELLEEIILVEDNCVKEEFHSTLDIYLEAVFGGLVRMLRNSVTLGLIRARLAGIRAARGEVVVCMDSHMEVQKLWLEPLLFEIKTNRKTLATSYLDWIEESDGKWSYRHGASTWKTYFDLGLVFGFQENSPKTLKARNADLTAALECPVTVGTIWAMDRKFFTEIGEFDEGMKLWGGENLDLPIRVWLFGGRVVNVPCSHAAHLEATGYRNYRSHWTETINRNYKRFMLVWLPEYFQHFHPYFPTFEKMDAGDLSARLAIKQRAHHNMTWFLNNVFPELGIPQIHGLAWGEVTNAGTAHCLMDSPYSMETGRCNGPAYNFYFFWSKDLQELRFPMHVFNVKKTLSSGGSSHYKVDKEEYTAVFRMDTSSQWLHWRNGPLMIEKENICLQTESNGPKLEAVTCDFNNPHQKWTFSNYSTDYEDIVRGTSQQYKSLMESLQKYKQYLNETPGGLWPST